MLELDECDKLLATNPLATKSSTVSSSDRNNHDVFVTPLLNSSSDHPLRTRPLSPARRYNTPGIPSVTVVGSEGETRPRLMSLPSLDGSSAGTTSSVEALRGSRDTIIHAIGPNDSFAGVALRYGVSIAALRRANQLWPSDPIHFRTELLIPRGDTLRAGHKSIRSPSMGATLRSTIEPTPGPSTDLVTSSFVAARNMIFSVLPARLSLDSLSSKASASEDHELDNLPIARAHKISTVEAPLAENGHGLSVLAASHAQHGLSSGITLSSQFPCPPTNNKYVDHDHIFTIGHLRSRSVSSSPTVPPERLPHRQPFALLPVRTSQLEPEPAMELPVRRSCV